VLILGQLSRSNVSTGRKTPRIDLFGAVVTMDRVGDQWLISKVDYGSPTRSGRARSSRSEP
jgi:hypothetical protein